MDEGRKRVLLIAASILAARKLAQFDGGKRVPATVSAIADAVRWAEEIMKAIDERWPTARCRLFRSHRRSDRQPARAAQRGQEHAAKRHQAKSGSRKNLRTTGGREHHKWLEPTGSGRSSCDLRPGT